MILSLSSKDARQKIFILELNTMRTHSAFNFRKRYHRIFGDDFSQSMKESLKFSIRIENLRDIDVGVNRSPLLGTNVQDELEI